MQRMSPCWLNWLAALVALYVSNFAHATDWPQPAYPATSYANPPTPHYALLLPLSSPLFSAAAQAVQQGFLAASSVAPEGLYGKPEVRIYRSSGEGRDAVALYFDAIAGGAVAVAGPLTRNEVAALASEPVIPVPTLALNLDERLPTGPLYFFGMEAEAEARQIARMAREDGSQNAIVISSGTPLTQRLQFAFEEEWHRLGGRVISEMQFSANPAMYTDIAYYSDTMLFLALNNEQARLVRPYLPDEVPTYATSLIFSGNRDAPTNFDLNGIHFVDMPWLLEPDHPAVMIFPRSAPPLPVELERFYALGVDAYRLLRLLRNGRIESALPLDGVTGQIQLTGHTFRHESAVARFIQGRPQLASMATPDPAAPVFPDRVAATP